MSRSHLAREKDPRDAAKRSRPPDRVDPRSATIGHDLREGALPGLTGQAAPDTARPALLAIQRAAGNRAAVELVVERQATKAEEAKAEQKTSAPTPAGVARITFRTSGDVEGTSKVPGHEGAIEFSSLTIDMPRGEGERARSRQLTFTKPVDKSSAIFFSALTRGDTISSATFELIRSNDSGGVDTYFTLEVHDAVVMKVNRSGDTETISIAFEPAGK